MLRKKAAVVSAADIGQSTAIVLLNGKVQTKGGKTDLVITALLLKSGTPTRDIDVSHPQSPPPRMSSSSK